MDAQSFVREWCAAMLRGSIDALLWSVLLLALWWPMRRRVSPAFTCGLFLLLPCKLLLFWEWSGPKFAADWSPRNLVGHWSGESYISPASDSVHSWAVPLFVAWIGVVAFLSVRWMRGHWATRRLLQDAVPLDDKTLGFDWSVLCNRLGFRGSVPCFASPCLSSPFVFGLWRPGIYLPWQAVENLSVDQRRWVLLHELAHIRRGDLWFSLVQRLVGIAYFFHPAVWLVQRMIDRHREFACDDWALACSSGTRRSYGAGFLSVVERVCNPGPCPSTLGFFDDPASLRLRLTRILDARRPVAKGLSRGAFFLLAILALLVVPGFRHEPGEPTQTTVVASVKEAEVPVPGMEEPALAMAPAPNDHDEDRSASVRERRAALFMHFKLLLQLCQWRLAK